ncbi:hypothetical protein D9756_010261 [Leucocoprinus leucothites]|uniref:DUF6533 domain-containing protein n=1 Tax=Leucocoprinus leucothites TaxID=201217 RepID=A0A8H5FSR8_9AGAR|nr:hypothetical protein D9756_010261 [Leucoagaricus leucothites]
MTPGLFKFRSSALATSSPQLKPLDCLKRMAFNTTAAELDHDVLLELIYRQQINQYFNVASVSYWLYESFLTIIPEIALIWSSPWSKIKVLYLLTKYGPIIDSALAILIFVPTQITAADCKDLYVAHTISLYIGIVLAEVMLVYRVWVVWNKDKRLGIFLFLFSLISVGTATGLTVALVNSFVVMAPQPPHACTIVSEIGPLQTASLSFILGYAFVLTFLMALQYLHTRREGPYAGAFVRAAQLDGLVPYLFVLFCSQQYLLCREDMAHSYFGRLCLIPGF